MYVRIAKQVSIVILRQMMELQEKSVNLDTTAQNHLRVLSNVQLVHFHMKKA